MTTRTLLTAAAALTAAVLVTGEASATNYTLYVHGRYPSSGSGCSGNSNTGWSYWGGSTRPGVNARSITWNGRGYISSTNYKVRNGLDTYCTGSNWCYVAAHSAGAYQVEYALDHYGTSGGSNRWNIIWTNQAGAAIGGSELANLGSWTQGDCLVEDLKTGTARSKYNHNNTRGVTMYMFAGAKGGIQAGLLPGEDDGAVAFHSAAGYSTTGSWGVPESCDDWYDFCSWPTASMGTSGKYSNHSLYYRDNGSNKDHHGIIGPMYDDMNAYAN